MILKDDSQRSQALAIQHVIKRRASQTTTAQLLNGLHKKLWKMLQS